MLAIKSFNDIGSRSSYDGDFKELAIEGEKELQVLCPVSKLTGRPMSMQQAIFMISDKNSRLADLLFQEIPAIRDSEQIDDNEKFKMLVSRLDTGSFFENDNVAEILCNIAKEFFPSVDVNKVVQEVAPSVSRSSAEQAIENV